LREGAGGGVVADHAENKKSYRKIVIAGLDPAIHLDARASVDMDARVKPAHDNVKIDAPC
jgi:hypothetical protein